MERLAQVEPAGVREPRREQASAPIRAEVAESPKKASGQPRPK
jgi:hypothetical protein